MSIFKRNKPIENIMDKDNATDWHDVDYFNKDANTSVDYTGVMPVIDNENLNWMFPKGEKNKKMTTAGMTNETTKRYYQIFQKIKMAQMVMVSQFDWNGLPDEIRPLQLEEKLTLNGSVAIIKIAGKYYAVNYSTVDKNIYDEPIKIKVNEPDVKLLNKQELDKFVIIYNDSTHLGLYQMLSPEINPWIEAKIMLARNPKDTRPQGFFPVSQNNVKTVSEMVSSLRNSNSPYHTIIVDDKKNMFESNGSASKSALTPDGKGNLFIDGSLPNNAEELLLVCQYWENEFKKALGLNISGGKTNERTIQSQLGTEQAMPKAILHNRFKYRDDGCKKLKEVFELNVSVEKVELDDKIVDGLKDTTVSEEIDNNES